MRLQLAIAVTTFASSVICMTGCTSQAGSPSQELRVPMPGDPSTLDPTQEIYQNDAYVTRNVFEPLTEVKADLSDVVGAAASNWSVSSDGLTWTFNLRKDGRYSDGSAVTAADFVYSYSRILDPRVASGNADPFLDQTIAGAENYPNVDPKNAAAVASFMAGLGVSAPDAQTFVVRLQHPAAYFKWLTSLFVTAPLKKSEVDAVGSANFGTVSDQAASQIIGNGPFRIADLKPKDHITLEPNPYYRSRPNLQKLSLREMNGDSAYLAYQNGELDLTTVPTVDSAVTAKSAELVRVPALQTNWLQFNTAQPPFNNVDLRHAFAQAIDRNALVADVLNGRGIAALTLIPRGMNGYRPDLGQSQAFNLEAARASLTASGYTASQLNAMNLSYMFSGSSTAKSIAEFLQNQFQTNLGVNVALQGLDARSMSARLHSGSFTIQGVSGWIADYPDSEDFFDNFVSTSPGNFGRFLDPAFDSAVAQADASPDGPARKALYAQAETILAVDAPVAFLDQPQIWWLVKPYVKNYVATPIDDFIGDFHLSSIQITSH